jgi:hypothetical protein
MSDYETTVEQAEANLAANPETAKKIDDFLKDPSSGVVYQGRHAVNADAVAPDNNDDDLNGSYDDDDEEDDDLYDDGEDDDDDDDGAVVL